MLVERLESVDVEVEGMLRGWRSVEEGGGVCRRLVRDC